MRPVRVGEGLIEPLSLVRKHQAIFAAVDNQGWRKGSSFFLYRWRHWPIVVDYRCYLVREPGPERQREHPPQRIAHHADVLGVDCGVLAKRVETVVEFLDPSHE